VDQLFGNLTEGWGKGISAHIFGPSMVDDEDFMRSWSKLERFAVSPGKIETLLRQTMDCDTNDILPVIKVPTLVLCRSGDIATPIEFSRYMAGKIPGAKMVELEGEDHFPWTGDVEALLTEVEEFVTGTRHSVDPDRVLATVLFTDIVDSTRHAVEMGDRKWRDLLERHNGLVRRELTRFRGREINNAGDGFLATFDGPARAVRCACAIRDAIKSIGITIRVGVHIGECEVMGDDVSGVAVHIGARVQGAANPDEILVSRTVKDLVVGSGLVFQDRGQHKLKGLPGVWDLYAVEV
jgi:class 3 adenylate cyclase